MSLPPGKLIVIEGLEGAGKSTAVNIITAQLSKLQIKTITTREPGGTAIGETLRSIIKNPEYTGILADKSELLLLYAARIQLVEQVIKPALNKGSWVVADRFELSTMAYQGGGRGLDHTMINLLSTFCLQGFKSDLTIYLDINPQIGLQRAKLRGSFDRIESQSSDFFQKVQQMYLDCIQKEPAVSIVDANRSLREVQTAIEAVIADFTQDYSNHH